LLIIGLAKLRSLACSVPAELLKGRIDELNKVFSHPLFRTYKQLASILRQQSNEAKEREVEAARQDRDWRNEQKPKEASIVQTGPRMPSTVTVTPKKRNISDTSFGTVSTETTPTKLAKPEQHIQQLQDTLVSDILVYVYGGGDIPVRWAEGRELYLTYAP
jgi:hypothetical protein